MKITLTQSELEHAIGCYLRANAAVKVGEITFSAKKAGVETIVETTVVSELPEQIDIEEAIANVEAAEKEVENPAFDFPIGITFDAPVEPETVEEMPVHNTMSIADILGSPS